MSESVIFTYAGATPGADSNTYNLFSSVTAFTGAGMHAANGLKRLIVDIKHNQNGTLKLYKSLDRGVNWHQVDEVSATATGATASDIYDALVEEYRDFKLDWTNGGSAQTTWAISVALSGERAPRA